MSLNDFIRKKQREVHEHGALYAGKTGLQEATVKAFAQYADYKATPIWDVEWDICLVLDATRYDLWKEVAPEYNLPIESKCSVGSASVEWIDKTFSDRYYGDWKDTAHVSANPHTGHPSDFSKHTTDVYPLREHGLPYLDEVWVDQWHTKDGLKTVIPERVTERAMYAWDTQTGFDKLLVHYMQPHIPFRKHPEWSPGWSNKLQFGKPLSQYGKKDDWDKLKAGLIEEDELWDAYKDNLRWVLEEVQRWQETTDATILITADHGNAMGEFGIYGHSPGNGLPELRKVPFVTIEGNGHREMDYTLNTSPPVLSDDNPGRNAQLQALGYK